ncbi:MAG: hypothetical protein ACOYEP_08315 [Limnochordia bacterium]
MQWERELKRLLAAYEAVQKELERKTGGSDGLYYEGSKDAYEYIISSLRNLISHAARSSAQNADNSAAA